MKYKLTENTKDWRGITLYQIIAVDGCKSIPAGTFGGYVQSEKNLDQSDNAWVSGDAWVSGNAQVFGDAWVSGNAQVFGNAWVSGDARVFGDAWVSGDARVFGNAWVFGNAQVFGDARVSGNARVFGDARVDKSLDLILIGPIGSRASFMTVLPKHNWISTGCFSGTKDEFLVSVQKTHGDNEHGKAYRLAVEFAFAVRGEDHE